MSDRSVLHVFGEEHVARLTDLSIGQLRAWDRAGFFRPRYADENRRAPYGRVYSLRDVVGLRTIARLMHEHKVSLARLRDVATELERRGYAHWADIRLYVVNGQVHFRDPGSERVEGLRDGQLAVLPIIDVINDVEARVESLRHREPGQIGKVARRRHVVRNAPVVAGTRIPTAAIRRFHEAGYSVDEIRKEYPSLTREDVAAALAHETGLAKSA